MTANLATNTATGEGSDTFVAGREPDRVAVPDRFVGDANANELTGGKATTG